MIGYVTLGSNDLDRALALRGTDEGAPGLRSPEGDQAFYGAYFRDPEGNSFCAFRTGPA